ncbi:MAG: lactate utilization protein C [candidate division KSB1 bacterium]|nr:lactate utilization protein C [candidate division KSB1 bacterium]
MDRNEFIRRTSSALGRERAQPPAWTTPGIEFRQRIMADRNREEMTQAFVASSRAVSVTVIETMRERLNASLAEAIGGIGAGSCLLADQPLFRELNTAGYLRAYLPVELWEESLTRQGAIVHAEKAGVGIAVADLAVAESGTVVVYSRSGVGRSVTLLPPATIYVVPQSVIRPRLTQVLEEIKHSENNEMSSSINFVTGPSATSDIELVRVEGVHGPMQVVYIIVKDI